MMLPDYITAHLRNPLADVAETARGFEGVGV